MPITGVNYKVNSIGTSSADGGVGSEATSGVDELFDSPLFDETGSSSQSQGADAMDDMSAYMGGTNGAADAAAGAAWLADFPPTLEEIIAGNEKAIDYLDLIVQRYEKAKDDLWALKLKYEEAQASGQLTADEAKVITDRLPLIDAAISRCGNEIDKCYQKSSDLEKTYVEEFRCMKDLDNDGWIGRKFAKNSYKIELDEDDLPVYFAFDGVSFTAVPCPIMDPEYQAEVFSGSGLVRCEQSPSGKAPDSITDVYMQLTEGALQNTNAYGCPIDVGVPEYLWCAKDLNGTPETPYKTEFDGGEAHAVLAGGWVEGNGLTQAPPEDLSKAIQVKVTGVTVRSVEAGFDSEGNAVYHQVIEFKHGEDVLCRIQVEGCEVSGANPAACSVDGRNYVAASSVGIALHDSNRASPVIVNCEDLQSTGRHAFADIENTLGINGPGDGDRGDRSYNETVGQFRDKDYTNYTWNNDPEVQEWEENEHNFDDGTYAYGASNDRYMPASESEPGDGEGCKTYNTGVFITGLRGDITGSRFNDVIQTRAVNDYSQYALDHMPASRREIKKDDPFYANFVNCGNGGNDIVVASAGDNYILDATMVWVNGSGAHDENYIAMPEMPGEDAATGNKSASPNQKNFVHLDGGKSYVSIPDEGTFGDTDGTTTTDVTKNDGSYLDDWYEVEEGSVQYGTPNDSDVVNSPDSKHGNTNSFKRDLIEKAKTDTGVYDEFYDALTEVPNPEDSLPEVDWDEVNSQKSALDEEMDSFFGEMFGEDFDEDGSFSEGTVTEPETGL